MTYIVPQISPDTQKIDENSQPAAAAGKNYYIEAEKRKFRGEPDFHLQYRKRLESALTEAFPMFIRGTRHNTQAKAKMQAMMLAKFSPGNEELEEKFIPSWSPGCRRLTPSEGYLETLTVEHVDVVHEEIV
jgi:hypothetical protein